MTATADSTLVSARMNWPRRCSSPLPRRSTSPRSRPTFSSAVWPRRAVHLSAATSNSGGRDRLFWPGVAWSLAGYWNVSVRFVQIWSGADNTFPRPPNWDSHRGRLARDHGPMASGSMARGSVRVDSRPGSSAACSTTRSCCGRRSSVACRRRRAEKGATTTRFASRTGCAAAASRAA